jgi:hypothetical protein
MEINSAPLDFSIRPNPASSSIQIDIVNNPGTFQYELFDALGIVRKQGLTSDNEFGIDVAGLAGGNYYLRISHAGRAAVTKRVVIEK